MCWLVYFFLIVPFQITRMFTISANDLNQEHLFEQIFTVFVIMPVDQLEPQLTVLVWQFCPQITQKPQLQNGHSDCIRSVTQKGIFFYFFPHALAIYFEGT